MDRKLGQLTFPGRMTGDIPEQVPVFGHGARKRAMRRTKKRDHDFRFFTAGDVSDNGRIG